MIDPGKLTCTVSAADFAAGNLPRISPLSGAPAGEAVKFKYRTAPQWTTILIILGLLVGVGWIPGVLIRLAVSKTANGVIYLTPDEKKRMRVNRLMPWAAVLLAIVLFVVAGFPQTPAPGLFVLLALALFGVFVLSFLFLTVGPKAVVSERQPGAKVVTFRGVSSAFATAMPATAATP